ncbi:MAG: glycosyltransferase family 1 protein, partial [Sphaerobacter sp.]|nr:glycosyltransferase family 1 protein [Sphaerobacter sp.]
PALQRRLLIQAARRAGVDLLHVPYFAGPRCTALPLVITVHDVIPFIFPEYAGGVPMRLYLRLVSAAARRADAIITDSDCSRRDITRWLGIPPERIHVIPLAVDPAIRPRHDPEAAAALRQRYGLPGPVIFNVGGVDVRKNLPVLIEAFARALPELPPETRLVIAGRAHARNPRLYPPLEPVIRRCGVEGKVVLTGAISAEEKLAFYNLADLYVFPSLYEGFGLSPLEAMACGTPVIAADRASLPEVVGSGGLLVEPTPPRLAAAMVSVLRDDGLRRDLARRALAQAQTFSWERTAAQTRAVYRSVLASRQPARAARVDHQ